MTPGKIPLKARLPWFAVWVPLALLLYLLVNGAGHAALYYRCLGLGEDALAPLSPVAPFLWGPLWYLPYPCLIVLAFVSWKLIPQWSATARWTAGMAGFLLLCLLLLAQVWLVQKPFGWPPAAGNLAKQGRMLAWLWRPHMSRLWLDLSARDIAECLGDPDPCVRRNAADSLGQLGAKEFTPQIAELLKDPDPGVRAIAAHALGELGAKEFTPRIAALMKDPVPIVRAIAVRVLGQLDVKEFVPQIAALLKDPVPITRGYAAEALGRLGAKECAPQIATLLEDPDPLVRECAASALGKLGATPRTSSPSSPPAP